MRPPKKADASSVYPVIVDIAYGASCDKDNIPTRRHGILPEPDRLTQTPFDPVAFNRVADSSADRKAETAVRQIIGQKTEYEISICERTPLTSYCLKAFIPSNSISSFHSGTECLVLDGLARGH